MKIERRGKYPGVKVHLEPEEIAPFLALADDIEAAGLHSGKKSTDTPDYITISIKIGKRIRKEMDTHPDLLKERTPAQVKEALLKDQAKITAQLKAGKDWKHVD